MADTAIAITAGSGTNVDTRTEGTNGNHRQVIVIGDPATNAGVAPVDGTTGLKVDLGADNDVVVSGTVSVTGVATSTKQSDGSQKTQIVDGSGNVVGSTGNAIDVNVKSGNPTTITATQSTASNLKAQVVAGDATGSSVPANAYYQGFNPQTSLPTAATAGQLQGATADKFGRQVVLPGTIRDLVGTQTTTISASTTETTIVTAAASTFNDLTALVLSNTSATATRVDFRDTTGGSVLFSIYVPAADVRGVSFSRPVPQTSVNTNWTAQSSASITDLRVYAVFDKNK